MKKIFKYTIDAGGENVVRMPVGARVVHVAAQGDYLCLWAVVDVDNDFEPREFTVTGTGHPVPEGKAYLGACMCDPFVWHVWE